MALSTFGAIMGFAAEITGQTKGAINFSRKSQKPCPQRDLAVFIRGGREESFPHGEDATGKCNRDDPGTCHRTSPGRIMRST